MKISTQCAAALCLFATASTSSASSLSTGVGVISGPGNSSIAMGCTTFGPPAELRNLVPSTPLSIPLGGISRCDYVGGFRVSNQASGTATDSYAVAPVLLGLPGHSGSFNGTANATASYGSLGASAHAEITGGIPGSPSALYESVGVARFSDTLTASSPLVANATSGYVIYQFTVDGALAALGPSAPYHFGAARAQLEFQHQNGSWFAPFSALQYRGSIGKINYGTPLDGWTTETGSLSGSSTFTTLEMPINWGQAWDINVGLFAWAYGTADASFLATAKLTGLELFDANHNAISDFSLTAASGTDYLAALAVVPEPAAVLLMPAGLALLGSVGLARRRRRFRHAHQANFA
jgi:hypothetical protein